MKVEWPTAFVLVATLAAIVVAWVTAPEHRAEIVAGVGAFGSVVLAAMRSVFRSGQCD